MWLAGHTYAFRALPLEAALDELTRLGFADVEVWLGHGLNEAEATAEVVARSGLRARAVSAGGFYTSGSDVPRRAFELAAALDVDRVVMCVAPPLVGELVGLAPPSVRVAVENHWDQPLARSGEVFAAIAPTHLEACLDTGHALAAGERPERAAARLGGRLAHAHLKEGRLPALHERLLGRRLRRRLLGQVEPVWPGAGDLDVEALRAALEAAGFTGCVTVEHEGERPGEALALLTKRWGGAD